MADEQQEEQLPGTEMTFVKLESTNTETAGDFVLGDNVKVSGTAVVCAITDEIQKDDSRRRVVKLRPDGWTIA